jgi:hypothetical protein
MSIIVPQSTNNERRTASKMSDWIGQEHSMASVPPRVHRIAKDVFVILQEFHFEILPSSMLPITEIREFSVHPRELSHVANTKKLGLRATRGRSGRSTSRIIPWFCSRKFACLRIAFLAYLRLQIIRCSSFECHRH